MSGKQAVRALLRLGFKIDRIRGSHHVLLHDGPPVRAVSVPVHGNKPLPRGTLNDIVKKSGFSVEEIISSL
ncbi:MAG: type II toxin-antitoxin system HicA family toxin [Mesorhizobium sp.]|nr:type II toxin-antitoxin system HicA family toxin [Mesorhizobium sp.]MCO5163079.1 type II toxin-antitoxin system HicA family toxin [Mesorhizobium sp.]